MRNRRSPCFTAWLSTTWSSTIRPETSGTTLMTSAITVASSVCGCRTTRPMTTTASTSAPAMMAMLSSLPRARIAHHHPNRTSQLAKIRSAARQG